MGSVWEGTDDPADFCISIRGTVRALALHPEKNLIGVGLDDAYIIYNQEGEVVWERPVEHDPLANNFRAIDFSPVAPVIGVLVESMVGLFNYERNEVVNFWQLRSKHDNKDEGRVQCHPYISSIAYYSSPRRIFLCDQGSKKLVQLTNFANSLERSLNRVHRSLLPDAGGYKAGTRGSRARQSLLAPTSDKCTVFSMATFHPILPLALTSRKDHIFIWNTAFAREGKAVLLAAISTALAGPTQYYTFTHSGVVCATSSSSVLKHWTLGARKSEDVTTTAVLDGLGWHRGRVVGVFDSVGSVTVTYPDIPRVAPVRCEEQNPPLQMHYAAGMLDSVKMGFVKGLLGPLMLLAIVCRVCCCPLSIPSSAVEKSFAKGQRGGDMLGIFLGVLTHLAVASLIVNFVFAGFGNALIPLGVMWCVVAIFSIFFMEMVLRGVVKIDSGEALWHSLPAVPGWRVMFWVVIVVFCITLNSPGVPVVYRWIDLGVTIVKFVILGVLARQVMWVREQIPLRAHEPYGGESTPRPNSPNSMGLRPYSTDLAGSVTVNVGLMWRPWMATAYLTIFPTFRQVCKYFLHSQRHRLHLPDDLCYEVLSFLAPRSSEWLEFLVSHPGNGISLSSPFSSLADGI